MKWPFGYGPPFHFSSLHPPVFPPFYLFFLRCPAFPFSVRRTTGHFPSLANPLPTDLLTRIGFAALGGMVSFAGSLFSSPMFLTDSLFCPQFLGFSNLSPLSSPPTDFFFLKDESSSFLDGSLSPPILLSGAWLVLKKFNFPSVCGTFLGCKVFTPQCPFFSRNLRRPNGGQNCWEPKPFLQRSRHGIAPLKNPHSYRGRPPFSSPQSLLPF